MKRTGWNCTLRPMSQKRRDNPRIYGPLYRIVREFPCCLKALNDHHQCGPGSAPSAPHHVVPVGRGGTDLDGLVKLCGRAHDVAEAQKGQAVVDFSSLDEGLGWVDLGSLGQEILTAALVKVDRLLDESLDMTH